MAKILITGGSGLIGTHLSRLLSDSGHEILHLSRSDDKESIYQTYTWDLQKGTIDERAFDGLDHIIHLAGAGVADKRWTKKRKQLILKSRTEGVELLHRYVSDKKIRLKSFISASGISYYGMDTGERLLNEDTEPGDDFLAGVVEEWESKADLFKKHTQVTKLRISVVLSDKGGALPAIAQPVRLLAGAPLGSGNQYMSWIHIDDLCRMFRFVIEKNISGIYNAAAPNPVTNEKLTKIIARVLHRPLFLPNVPAFVMKLLLGERAQMVLGGNKVLGKRIQQKGFAFRFTEAEEAVKDLLSK